MRPFLLKLYRRFISENELSVDSIFVGLTCVVIVRSLLEFVIEERTLSFQADFYDAVVVYGHMYVSWMCIFIGFALLLSVFLQIALKESLKIVLWLSPIIITVPVVDYFVGSNREIVYAESLSTLLHDYTNLFNPWASVPMVTTGVRIEVFLITLTALLSARFVFNKSVLRAVGLAVSGYSFIFMIGYLPALLPGVMAHSRCGYFAVYLPVFVALMSFSWLRLLKENPQWGRVIAHLLFPSRLFFYLMILCFGMLFSAKKHGVYPAIFLGGGLISLAAAIFSITLLFAYAKSRNDLNDIEIDLVSEPDRPVLTSVMSREAAHALSRALLFPSFVFALAAERFFFLFWLLIWALSSLYSEPPLRLRRFYPVGHYLLSLIGVSLFLAGASLVDSRNFILTDHLPALLGGVFLCFFFLSHIKDLKDLEGDAKAGISSIYQWTRRPRTIAIAAIGGFSLTLVYVLNLLDARPFLTLPALCVYAAASATAILKTRDLHRLDWILSMSLGLVIYLATVWLAMG